MMITLSEAKQYLRVVEDDEDSSILSMIAAAEQHLTSIGISLDTAADPMPAPLKQAALMLVAHFFDGRGVTQEELPRISPAFDRLIAPYRENVT